MIECDRVTVERLGVVVLERLDLCVSAGQAVAVIGPTAAGKTSLLETIATLLPLRSGELTVAGYAATQQGEAIRRLVGYVPDGVPAWPAIRIDECLELFAAAGGLRGRDLTSAVGRALARVGLERMAGARCDAVSSGQSNGCCWPGRCCSSPPSSCSTTRPPASIRLAGNWSARSSATLSPPEAPSWLPATMVTYRLGLLTC
jgi:ABC-type Mn2+/Zn2+ transport system ATPase subunit